MTTADKQKHALILGASRGLGLGLVQKYLEQGWKVLATERAPGPDTRLGQLAEKSSQALRVEQLDINDQKQIEQLAEKLKGASFDLLFVVAGVSDDPQQLSSQISNDEFAHLMLTNALSPMRALEAFSANVPAEGVVAVMSSALGSVSTNTEGGYESYRASKAALNSLLRSFSARKKDERTYIAMMPGWVRTDMGGPDAPVEIEDSTDGMAKTIAARQGNAGVFFIDFQGNEIAW